MTLFRNDTAREVWMEKHCDVCAQRHGGCAILTRALATDRKPPEWDRNARATTMDGAYKCHEFLDRPKVLRRATVECETLPMFEVDPADQVALVPVEGWPDHRPKKNQKGRDHA